MFSIEIDEVAELPTKVKDFFKANNITKLFPPQVEAIDKGLLKGENLVVSAPTASGKTLVASMAMLKKASESEGKTLYLVPLRALAYEKYEEFLSFKELGPKVAVSTGDYDSSDPQLSRYDVIIATNEKADSLLRHHAEWLEDVALTVADEVHLIGDNSRGPTLEVVLSRLRETNPHAQFLALSATIRNALEIAEWLQAKVVYSSWRPVPLKTGVYYGGRIIFGDGSIVEAHIPKSLDPVTGLSISTILERGQVLVFNNTRQSSLNYAERMRDHIIKTLSEEDKRSLKDVADHVLSEGEVNRISQRLAECIKNGAAFHHAGLSPSHRRIVEKAFKTFKLKVVCSTPTLAAGVNLPARRVILQDYRRYDPSMGYSPIQTLEFHQMAGRAGRPQYDEYGEAILIAKGQEELGPLLENYVLAPPERVWSKLANEPALRSHILAFIASFAPVDEDGLTSFIDKTFYAHQYGWPTVMPAFKKVLNFLETEGFIAHTSRGFIATMIGQRVSQLYIDPLSAVILRNGLSKNTQTTPLAYLHLICSTPDMAKMYLRRGDRRKLDAKLKRRIQEMLIPPPDSIEEPYEYESYLSSLKTSLILNDWIEERSEDYIIEEHGVGPGDVYNLSQTASWIAYAAKELCLILNLHQHLQPLQNLKLRLEVGCREDALQLATLEGIGRVRARQLYNFGYRSLEDLAKASIGELTQVPTIGLEIAKLILRQLRKLRES